jgi:hypothetical protein
MLAVRRPAPRCAQGLREDQESGRRHGADFGRGRAGSTRQAAADLNSGRDGGDGGRPLPVENLAPPAVYQGGSLPAEESISGRIALGGRRSVADSARYFQIDGLGARLSFDHLVKRLAV